MRRLVLIAALVAGCGDDRSAEIADLKARIVRLELWATDPPWWCASGKHDGAPTTFCTRKLDHCERNAADLGEFGTCVPLPVVWCFEGRPEEPSCHPTLDTCDVAMERFQRVTGNDTGACRTML